MLLCIKPKPKNMLTIKISVILLSFTLLACNGEVNNKDSNSQKNEYETSEDRKDNRANEVGSDIKEAGKDVGDAVGNATKDVGEAVTGDEDPNEEMRERNEDALEERRERNEEINESR